MSDLASLMQYAPTTAAYMIGSNQASQDQQQAADLQNTLSTVADRNARLGMAQQLQPYDVQKADLANQTTQAALPGVVGKSNSAAAKGSIDQALVPSSIDAGVAKNRMDAYTSIGDHLGSLVGDLDGVPDIQKHQAIVTSLQNSGLPPNLVSTFANRYVNTPASELKDKIQADAERIQSENERYRQAFDTTSLTTSGEITRSAQSDASRERIADTYTGGRANVANIHYGKSADFESQLSKIPGAGGKINTLIDRAGQVEQSNPDLAASYRQRAAALRAQEQFEADSRRAPVAGSISPAGITGLPANPGAVAPTIQQPQPQPSAVAGQPPVQGGRLPNGRVAPPSYAYVRSLFPDAPEADLRAYYNKTFPEAAITGTQQSAPPVRGAPAPGAGWSIKRTQ